MFNKSGFIYVFVVCAVFLFLTFVKGADIREKRQADIFQTGMALAMDKGLEFVQIVEHGVKFEDKSDHDIDVFGAKIERQNGHKVGYGDSMRADTDDDDDRRKKRQSENQQQGGGDFEKEIKEVEGAWSQMWSKVVESAKQMWKKVSTKFGADGQQQQGQGGQQGQQGPQGQPGQRGQEEQF